MKIGIIVGTRPEVIKMMPIIKWCHQKNIDYFIIHSNQHYSENMDKIFFEELDIPAPKYNLKVGSGKHSNMTGNILIKMEPILEDESPDLVLVQGDTNTVLAGALAASKLGIKVGHIEAGLRSYDRTMPEETNRIVTDHISDYLFAVTNKQEQILLSEGVHPSKIHVVGNTVVDALFQNKDLAKEKSDILEKNGLSKDSYFLVTVHRASNVDNEAPFREVAKILNELVNKYEQEVFWPIHPRALKYLKEYNIKLDDRIKLAEPCGYLDFIQLQANAKLILTDSGGVQEEACSLKVPCVTLRYNTERPETVDVGSNILVGRDFDKAFSAINDLLSRDTNWDNPFGTGKTTETIFNVLTKDFNLAPKVGGDQKVCVIGLGYMGLPMASIIANSGFNVTGVDLNNEKVEMVNKGLCPFEEKGMPEIVKSAVDSGNLVAKKEIPSSDIYLLSLPTDKKDNKCDLSIVKSVCEQLVSIVEDGNLVIVESTIRPNTIKDVVAPILEKSGKKVLIAHCPERAIPGNTTFELVHNDRIIGGLTEEATEKTFSFYNNFIKGKMHKTSASAAECAKLMENTFRDVNIALANEFDVILDELGVDVLEAIDLANKHPRVNILKPGPGVGGHCIAIDPWFLTEHTDNAKLITTSRNINDQRPHLLVNRMKESFGSNKNVALLGVAYKPNVDDARETPSLDIYDALTKEGYTVKACDPHVKSWNHDLTDLNSTLEWADVIVIATKHDEYKDIKTNKPIFDCMR